MHADAGPCQEPLPAEILTIVQDPKYCRFGCKVDMDLALQLYNRSSHEICQEEDRYIYMLLEGRSQ